MARTGRVVATRMVATLTLAGLGLATPVLVSPTPASASPAGATAVLGIATGGHENIWTMHGGGTGLTQLIPDAGDPSISPDGNLVAFNKGNAVWLMNLDGSGSHQFGPAGSSLPLAPAPSPWSPDSQHLVFGANRGLWVGAVTGSAISQLTPTPTDGATDSGATWSPDGAHVAYLEGLASWNQDLWVVDANGSGALQVTHLAATNSQAGVFSASWAPDSSKLVAAETLGTGPSQLQTVQPDGTAIMTMAMPFGVNLGAAPWAADGQQLVYAAPSSADPEQDLWVVNADGTNNHQITSTGRRLPGCNGFGGGVWDGAWLPDGSGIAALARNSVDAPGCPFAVDVVVLHADGSGMVQLTNFSDASPQSPVWTCNGPCNAFPTGQATTTTLSVTSPSTYEQETATTMHVSVTSASGTPSGTVTVWKNFTSTGSTTLCVLRVPGADTCHLASPTELSPRTYGLLATFVPDDPNSFLPSTSVGQTLVVNPGPTKVAIQPIHIGLLSSQIVTYQAVLTSATTGHGLAGASIDFGPVGPLASLFPDARCSAFTDAYGTATCSIPLSSSLGDIISGHYSATFGGAGNYAPSSATAPVTVSVL